MTTVPRAVLALVVGAALGSLLHQPPVAAVVHTAAVLAVRAVQVFVFPMVFFGLVVGARELGRSGALRTHAWLIAGQAAATVSLAALGVLSVLAASPDRIPIIVVDRATASVPSFVEHLQQALPTNLFAGLAGDGALLLPVYLIALVLGLSIPDDRASRPLIELTEALSRLFFRINSFITAHLWAPLLLGSASLAAALAAGVGPYRELLLVVVIDLALVLGLLLPGWRFLRRKRADLPSLSALAVPVLTAVATGHHHAALASLARYATEDLRIPNRLGSAAFPLFAMFGRAGSAMVAAASFTVILRSYSSMSLAAGDVLWIIGAASVTAFALAAAPGGAVAAALALLAAGYGRGLEESYLVVDPVLPLLIAIGVAVDVVIGGAIAVAVGARERLLIDPRPKRAQR